MTAEDNAWISFGDPREVRHVDILQTQTALGAPHFELLRPRPTRPPCLPKLQLVVQRRFYDAALCGSKRVEIRPLLAQTKFPLQGKTHPLFLVLCLVPNCETACCRQRHPAVAEDAAGRTVRVSAKRLQNSRSLRAVQGRVVLSGPAGLGAGQLGCRLCKSAIQPFREGGLHLPRVLRGVLGSSTPSLLATQGCAAARATVAATPGG